MQPSTTPATIDAVPPLFEPHLRVVRYTVILRFFFYASCPATTALTVNLWHSHECRCIFLLLVLVGCEHLLASACRVFACHVTRTDSA